jgi:F-type H+-transporting ATPase subunit b
MLQSAAQAAETALEHTETVGFFANPESWVAITWLIVMLLLARPLGKAIIAGLDARRDRIREQLAEAERLRDEAQEALVSYQRKQREAVQEADAIIKQARTEASRLTEQASLSLAELVRRREQQALARIQQAQDEAIGEVRNRAVEIAIAAARSLIVDRLTADQAAALVDSAIQGLPSRLH